MNADDDFFPQAEWDGLPFMVFIMYLHAKLNEAERAEMRRLIHEIARDNQDGSPTYGDMIAIANAARFAAAEQ